jgi:hypothetical protein
MLQPVTEKEAQMELLLALTAFVIVDVLAVRFGADSRPYDTNGEVKAAVRSGN